MPRAGWIKHAQRNYTTLRPPSTPSAAAARETKLCAALVLMMLAGSCVTGSGSDPCAGWQPVAYEESDLDVISDTLAISLEQHNAAWEERCR